MNKRSKFLLAIVAFIIILALFSIWRNSKTSKTSNKPMVKVNDNLYYWDSDVEVNITGLEKLGKVEFSYENLLFLLGEKDKNFSSNFYPVGTEIFKNDSMSIIIAGDNFSSILKKQ